MSVPNALEIRIGSEKVGLLEKLGDYEFVFSFEQTWIENPKRLTLGQFFEDRRPRDVHTSSFPCWFSHLLPQGSLRRVILRDLRVEDDEDWALLCHLGRDLPGAVIALPTLPRVSRPASEPEPASDNHAQGVLRFALSGVQWKLSVREGERGLTIPVDGETQWIAKFAAVEFMNLPRIEFATMTWARNCGINVPMFRLGDSSELADGLAIPEMIKGQIFLIQRFDRPQGRERVHMEDFAQVLDRPNQYYGSYEELGAILASLCREDLEEFVRRLVFCVLSGNTDAHLKNWSLIYPDGKRPRLSPAYDLVSSVLYVPYIDDELALSINGSKRFEDVDAQAFVKLAAVCGVDLKVVSAWVHDAARDIISAWTELQATIDLSTGERSSIEKHLARVPLAGLSA